MCNLPDKENKPVQPERVAEQKDLAWRHAAKVYIVVHAVVALCEWFLGMEYLIGSRWVPRPICSVIDMVATLGFFPLVFSSPAVVFVMVFDLSRRHHEWFYLGVCDFALLVLMIAGCVMACH